MLRGMSDRIHVLTSADFETRLAMSKWRSLLIKRVDHPGSGIEEAAMLLALLNSRLTPEASIDLEEGDCETTWASQGSARSTLDGWASDLKEAKPHLFPPRSLSDQEDAITSLAEFLFAASGGGGFSPRVHVHPIEWLYDGTGPLLITEVLRDGKGSPLALAVIACLLGQRLGLASFPIPLSSPNASQGLETSSQDLLSNVSQDSLPDAVI